MPVILTIDIGSSRTKWGLHNGDNWVLFDHSKDHAWVSLMSLPLKPDIAVLSNVGAAHLVHGFEVLATHWDIPLIKVTPTAEGYGIQNGYEMPEKLGSDRWAALIGAWQRTQKETLIVDAGTAITLDYLDGSGRFGGGAILPGFSLMKCSLVEQTANLTLETGQWSSLPTNTADAISTGCIDAIIGAVEKMYHRLAASESPLFCMITGGDARTLFPYFQIPVYHAEHLVHEGLRHIGDIQLSEAL